VRLAWPSDFGIFLADEELGAGDIDPGIRFGLKGSSMRVVCSNIARIPTIFVLHTALYYTAAEQVYTAY
jgi:hypothetical protein